MTRVAITVRGDGRSPHTWSGCPYGLGRGLEALGAEVLHVSAEFPSPVRRVVYRRLAPTQVAAGLGAVARRRLGRAGDVGAVIQVGSEYEIAPRAPVATFEDMTVLQAQRVGNEYVTALSERAIRRWADRQRRVYDRATVCCVASEWAARSLRDDYGIPAAKIAVVGFGRNREVSNAPRDWATPRFLFVGREWERKDGPGVLRAFARLRADLPDARLDVVGGHPPLAAPGVTGHGVLRLDVPEQLRLLDDLYAAATCLVVPSKHEPFGIAYAEAASGGLPSIGTSVGGAPEVIGTEGGLLVAPGDGEALEAAMRSLADPARAQAMGAAARARSDSFTWAAVARRVAAALGLEAPAGAGQPASRDA